MLRSADRSGRRKAWAAASAVFALWLIVGGCGKQNDAQKQKTTSQTQSVKGKIAFSRARVGNNPFAVSDEEIYAMDADGSNESRLTTNEAVDWGPSFRPQG